MKAKKLFCLFMTVGIVGSVLMGCQSKESKPEAGSKTESRAAGDTVTITDAVGKVEIPADPKRIVDISGCSDILHILGYEVVGTANSDAYDYTRFPSYLGGILDEAEILGYFYQDTMDVEAVIDLEPDLIIISSVQEKMYEQLHAVAPTVMIELAQIDWTEDLRNVAGVMGKEEQADAWLAEYEAKTEAASTKVKELMGEEATYAAFLASGGSIFVFTEAGMGSLLYQDLDLSRPEGMPEQENVTLPVITYEGLAEIDADYMLAVGTDEDLEALKANDIWNSLACVQAGNYLELPADVYFGIGYSAVGRLKFLEEVTGLFESLK